MSLLEEAEDRGRFVQVEFVQVQVETTQVGANTTFNNYLSDQSVQENFDIVQHDLKCCGVVAFTDYGSIFNNLSLVATLQTHVPTRLHVLKLSAMPNRPTKPV